VGAAFEIIPAIDLLGGCCVRLEQGDYARATRYREDPAEQAAEFVAHPIPRLHVVDLDGARSGSPGNGDAIRRIARVAQAAGVPVQLGGGIRSLAAIEAALVIGVDRVVLGTAALRDPELLAAACRRFAGRVAVGIDARAGRVAVAGWLETTETSAAELARRAADAGAAAIVYTDIARDGMGSRLNVAATIELAESSDVAVIASGGVRDLDHLRELARAAASSRARVLGVITGRALYEGTLELRSAQALLQG